FGLPELSLPVDLPVERLEQRRELQKMIDKRSRLLDYSAAAQGLDDYYQRALAMLNSTRMRDAFNLAAEPQWLRDAYGHTTYGQSCLLARRLVEAGTEIVTGYFLFSIGGRRTTLGGLGVSGMNITPRFSLLLKYFS